MKRVDIVYIIDSISCEVLEKINLEYLDLYSEPMYTAVSKTRISQLQTLKSEYLYVLKKYHIDSPSNILKRMIKDVSPICLESIEFEMMSEKKSFCGYYSRGDFFSEIIDVVSESSCEIVDVIKYLTAIPKTNFILHDHLTGDCASCLECFVTIIKEFFLNSSCIEYVVNVLKVFSKYELMMVDIIHFDSKMFKYLMECSRLGKYNYGGIWQTGECHSFLSISLSEVCYENFITLLELGAENVCSFEVYQDLSLELESMLEFQESNCRLFKSIHPNRRNILIMQAVVMFYHHIRYRKSKLPAKALVTLWSLMPDPYLAESDFIKFLPVFPEFITSVLQNCWIWYYENIYLRKLGSSKKFLSTTRKSCSILMNPRSLKHLARCTIRRNLAKNFRIPSDIDWRGRIPKELQEYLEDNLFGLNS